MPHFWKSHVAAHMTVLLFLSNEKPTCSMVRYMCSAGKEKLSSMRKRQGINFLFLGETVQKSQNSENFAAKFLGISPQKDHRSFKTGKINIHFFLRHEICSP